MEYEFTLVELYEYVKATMKTIAASVETEADNLHPSEVTALINAILTAHRENKRIFLTGAGRSGLVASAFAMRLMHLDFTVYVIGEIVTPAVESDDLVIAISGSGETSPISEMSTIIKEKGTKLAVVTSNKNSRLGSLADITVQISGRPHIDSVSFLERQLTGISISFAPLGTIFENNVMILMDSVIAGLMLATGKSEADMRQKHF
ncbi:MAG: 6-phospho-3-hexuloisomerase [Halobacteriota archaeon]